MRERARRRSPRGSSTLHRHPSAERGGHGPGGRPPRKHLLQNVRSPLPSVGAAPHGLRTLPDQGRRVFVRLLGSPAEVGNWTGGRQVQTRPPEGRVDASLAAQMCGRSEDFRPRDQQWRRSTWRPCWGGGRRRSPAGRSPTHRNFREPPHLPAPTRGPSEQQVKVGFGPLGKKRSSGSGVWGGDSEAPEEVPMPARCVPWPPRSLALHRDSLGPTGILGSEVPPPLCPAHAVPCQMRPQITPGLLT